MSLHALAIDDDADFRRLLRYHITSEWPDSVVDDYDPVELGKPGKDFPFEQYDVVLLDYEMGQENGLDWLRGFRALPSFPPIIFFTARSDERLAVTAIKAGAVDYIPKSRLTNAFVINALKESMRNAKSQSALFERPAGRLGFRDAPRIEAPGYRILRQLSSGGAGSVFLATADDSGDEVVLKVLHRIGDSDGGHAALARFIREVEVISALDHPNIVKIFDHGIDTDHAFIAMEYLSGGDLKARMRQHLSIADTLGYVKQIASALQAVHDVGMLHRDLKPANVMIRYDGSLALVDFGLARQIELTSELTTPGKIFGTPYYMSPEQGQGDALDQRSDLYSLGVILYEMLQGTKLYTAASPLAVIYKHCHAPLPDLPDNLQQFKPVLAGLLAKAPSERISSAKDLLQVLKSYEKM